MKFYEALDSITDPDVYRRISLLIISALGVVSMYAYNILETKINDVELAQQQLTQQHAADVALIREQHINRTEWTEIDRRISMYFEQLDRRLDRIENRLERTP